MREMLPIIRDIALMVIAGLVVYWGAAVAVAAAGGAFR